MTTTEAITKAQAYIIAKSVEQKDYSPEQDVKDAETIANLTALKIIARRAGMA